jgi:type II secretory pathway pseudopilin PulG
MRIMGQRGATLIEMMVAAFLIFLILAAATQLLVSCFRHYREVDAAAQVHQLALTSMSRMQRDLRDGNKASFRVFSAPAGIVFASPRQSDGRIAFNPDTLQPIWQKLICYYLEPDGTRFLLIRKEEPVASPSDTPPTIALGQDTAHFQTVSGGSVVARGVDTLTFTPGETLKVLLKVSDVTNEGSSSEALFSVEIETSVNFRN